MSKLIILFRGLPGAGKSTLAEELREDYRISVLSADQYFEKYNDISKEMEYHFDASKLHHAHQLCLDKTEIALQSNIIEKIYVTNTFTTEKELKPYYELAEKYGIMIFSVIVENRVNTTSVHGVPDETVEKMKNRFSVKL